MPDEVTPKVPVTAGNTTTEYAIARSANVWSTVGLILGTVMTILGYALPMAPENSKWGIIGGASVMVISQVYDMLAKLGYVKARTDLKIASLR